MKHHANPAFWKLYAGLPVRIQKLANGCFDLLKRDPRHPSLHLKKAGRFWSVRVGNHYRATGVSAPDGIAWFWIGTHEEYNKLIN